MPQSDDLEKQLADLETREHAIKQLLASAGWKEVVNLCDGAIKTRRQSAFGTMTGLKGFDDIFALVRLGGEIGGMQFVLQLPHIQLADIQTDLARVREMRRETENG